MCVLATGVRLTLAHAVHASRTATTATTATTYAAEQLLPRALDPVLQEKGGVAPVIARDDILLAVHATIVQDGLRRSAARRWRQSDRAQREGSAPT